MRERGWKGVDLAEAAEVTPTSVSRYLAGKAEPRAAELLRLAKALGTSMEFLLSGEDRPNKPPRLKDTEESVPYVAKKRPTVPIPDPADLDAAITALEANLGALRRFRASFDEVPKVIAFPGDKGVKTELPFYGWAAAGRPSDTDFHSDETMTVPGDYGRKPHYLLRVRGRSMEPDFPDGSYVVVRALAPGEYAKKGDVVITADSDGVAMKRLEYRKDGQKGDVPRKPTPHLVSINPDFPDVVPVSDCPIQGVVVECFPADVFDL